MRTPRRPGSRLPRLGLTCPAPQGTAVYRAPANTRGTTGRGRLVPGKEAYLAWSLRQALARLEGQCGLPHRAVRVDTADPDLAGGRVAQVLEPEGSDAPGLQCDECVPLPRRQELDGSSAEGARVLDVEGPRVGTAKFVADDLGDETDVKSLRLEPGDHQVAHDAPDIDLGHAGVAVLVEFQVPDPRLELRRVQAVQDAFRDDGKPPFLAVLPTLLDG